MMRQNLRKVWTPDEDAVLRSLAPSVSPQRIAIRLNRGLGSILKRAEDLKIQLLNKARLRKRLGTTYKRLDVYPDGASDA